MGGDEGCEHLQSHHNHVKVLPCILLIILGDIDVPVVSEAFSYGLFGNGCCMDVLIGALAIGPIIPFLTVHARCLSEGAIRIPFHCLLFSSCVSGSI